MTEMQTDEQRYFEPSEPPPEEASDAVQERGPAPLDVGTQAGYGRRVGEGVGFGTPGTVEEAEAIYFEATAYCERCPIKTRCAKEDCAVWHSKTSSHALIMGARAEAEAPEAMMGVPLEGTVG